jgi:hypothetical protein
MGKNVEPVILLNIVCRAVTEYWTQLLLVDLW